MIVAKSSQMQDLDKKTIEEYNIPGILLMEHAAIKVVDVVPNELQCGVVVCNTGNNGGDGLAVARLLYNKGLQVSVILVGDQFNFKADAKIMYDALSQLAIEVTWYKETTYEACNRTLQGAQFVIDAIFGIGCKRVIKGDYYKVISMINETMAYIVSIDIPSGINSDNGKIMGINVNADITVTFTLPKLGNLLYPGALATKLLKVVDIGIPQEALESYEYNYETLDTETLRYMPKRQPISHKMSYGKILMIAGSKGMTGAAYLAAKGAYRTGTGLVEIVTHSSCKTALQTSIPEAIITTYSDDFESLQEVMDKLALHIDAYDAILIGPGLSLNETSSRWLEFALKQPKLPVVIDADGLTILANDLECLEEVVVPVILTPHIGEMSRLTKYPSSAILENTVEFAQAFSKSHGVVVALKSGRTVVTDVNGNCCISVCGNNGMATAGSGDVLSGVITSILGQGLDAYKSACVGVAVHSLAGDEAAKKKGCYSLMASDIIDHINQVLR